MDMGHKFYPGLGLCKASNNSNPAYMGLYDQEITMEEHNGVIGELDVNSLSLGVDDND